MRQFMAIEREALAVMLPVRTNVAGRRCVVVEEEITREVVRMVEEEVATVAKEAVWAEERAEEAEPEAAVREEMAARMRTHQQ
jgi:hypothetical protein